MRNLALTVVAVFTGTGLIAPGPANAAADVTVKGEVVEAAGKTLLNVKSIPTN